MKVSCKKKNTFWNEKGKIQLNAIAKACEVAFSYWWQASYPITNSPKHSLETFGFINVYVYLIYTTGHHKINRELWEFGYVCDMHNRKWWIMSYRRQSKWSTKKKRNNLRNENKAEFDCIESNDMQHRSRKLHNEQIFMQDSNLLNHEKL